MAQLMIGAPPVGGQVWRSGATKTVVEGSWSKILTDGEGRAVIWAVRHFRLYLYGQRFTSQTEHKALQWLMTTETLQSRLAR